MKRKDDRELAIHEAKKLARSAIRLKYSILAERELNETLPRIEDEIDQAFANGDSFSLDIPTLYQLDA